MSGPPQRGGPPRLRVLAVGAALLGLPAAEARADDLSYRSVPIGGRAIGLGGAFTGLGSDPSGIVHNPAGLVDVRQGSVQVGTNLYGIEVQGTLTDAFGTVTDINRVVSVLDIIPAIAANVNVLSEGDEDGAGRTVFGLGSFTPAASSQQTSVIELLGPEERFPGCARLAYERTSSDRRFLFGGGVGHQLDARWSFGFSAFLGYRALRDREEIACSDEAGGVDGPAFSSADNRVDLDVFSLRMSFAGLARLDDGWSVGAVISPPSVGLFSSAGVRIRRTSALPASGRTDFLLEERSDLTGASDDGLEVRLGAAKRWPGKGTVALDLSFHAPVTYDLVEAPDDDADFLAPLTLTTRVQRNAVVNIAFGGEWYPSEEWILASGLFTNLSSAPEVPDRERFDEDRLAHVDEVGLTLLGGFATDHNLTRAGLVLTLGNGRDVVPRYAGLGAIGGRVRYVGTDVREAGIYVFVSNTTRY